MSDDFTPEQEPRTDEIKAMNYAAMLDGSNVITAVIDSSDPFCNELDENDKKARVSRSMGYLKHMVALDDWGSEDMTKINSAISAGEAFVG